MCTSKGHVTIRNGVVNDTFHVTRTSKDSQTSMKRVKHNVNKNLSFDHYSFIMVVEYFPPSKKRTFLSK